MVHVGEDADVPDVVHIVLQLAQLGGQQRGHGSTVGDFTDRLIHLTIRPLLPPPPHPGFLQMVSNEDFREYLDLILEWKCPDPQVLLSSVAYIRSVSQALMPERWLLVVGS